MRRGWTGLALALVAPLFLAHPVRAAEERPAGLYRAQAGPDAPSHLLIGEDGRFGFELIAGALDLHAQGSWQREGDGRISLTTLPRPRAPELAVGGMTRRESEPLTVRVTLPGGRGVQGVDFRIGLETGETIDAYTQRDGWRNDPADRRRPLWIELEEPIHDIRLDRTAVPAGANDLHFILTPHDVGVMDFDRSPAEFDGERLTVHSPRGSMTFRRVERRPEVAQPEADEEAGTGAEAEPSPSDGRRIR